MKKIARNFVLLGCIGSSVSAAPFLAIGDNAELFAVADASVTYNDNILLGTSKNEIDDTIFVLRPGFELQFGKDSLVTGSLFTRATLSSYADEDQLNNQLLAAGGKFAYNPGGRLNLSGHASFEELDQTVQDPNPLLTDIQGTITEREVTSAGLSSEFSYSEKFSVGLGGSFSRVNYLDSTGVNSKDFGVPVNIYYELTPKVDLSAGVSYKLSKLDGVAPGSADEFQDFYYNVGARGEFTPKLNGSFSVGYTTRDANRGDDPDGTIGATASLNYAYSDKTQLSFDLTRDFGTASSNGASYENTGITLGATSALTVDWSVNASISARRLDYDAGTNDFYDVTLGVGYTLNEHLTAGLSYSYREQFAEANGNDFINNIVSLTLSARY